jgi:rod shape determining protein RodA
MNRTARRTSRSIDNSQILKRIDWQSFSLFISLVIIGWLMVFSVNYEEFQQVGWSGFLGTSAGKQAVWVGISLFVFAFVMLFDWKFWQTFAYSIYIFSLVLLVLVLIVGTNIKGATSWFSFGGVSFQPSELAKFGTCLGMAAFLDTYSTDLRQMRSQWTALLILALPMGLILLQPDAGSALVFTSFLVLLYREGLSQTYFLVGGIAVALLLCALVFEPQEIYAVMLLAAIGMLTFQYSKRNRSYWFLGALLLSGATFYLLSEGFAWYINAGLGALFLLAAVLAYQNRNGRMAGLLIFFLLIGSGLVYASDYAFNNVLKPHQQDRINVWLQPDKCDARGSLYNLEQSKTAIGSGNFLGKGFTNGTMTKLNYVPEQSTDFIFCTIGEEQGFMGVLSIIGLFVVFIIRLTIVAERQRSNFNRYYAYGVVGILFLHVFINIGMTMGLMPIIGIPLPLISKGGSSLLGFTLMIAVLLKLDKHRLRAR